MPKIKLSARDEAALATTPPRQAMPYLIAFCRALVERADTLSIKGRRADDFALDSFAAAIVALRDVKPERATHMTTIAYLLIATRGMSEVRAIAAAAPGPEDL